MRDKSRKQQEMHNGRGRSLEGKVLCLAALFVTVMSLSACALQTGGNAAQTQNQGNGGLESSESESSRYDTGFAAPKPGDYDSADTPVVVSINHQENTITFLNLDIGRRYTLSMDGTTTLTDKYGETISLEQVEPGDIVDVTFLKEKKRLSGMQISGKAFRHTEVERYEINKIRKEVVIGDDIYKLSEDTLYFSDGKPVEHMDIHPSDILTFRGVDTTIYSVTVEKGHGYLRLSNDEHFIGGWIELGETQIHKITEEMLLTVPEGSYQVNISHRGTSGVKNVIINRNEETVLDIGDIEVAEPESGMVLFSISPSDASLYIDGTKVDASLPITLEYGIHQLIIKADGYHSITRYLRVGQASAGVDIVLEKVGNGESSVSDSDAEDKDTVDAATDSYKVYIDAPEDVEVYVDGNYIGIAPCSFKKTAGRHVISLRKNGYTTKNYTVQVDEEEKNTNYSFADLVKSKAAAENSSDSTSSLVSDMLGTLFN